MSELKDYASILPKEPPKKLLKTLIKEGYFKENYLVYRSEYVLNPLTEQKEKMVILLQNRVKLGTIVFGINP